ncbi:MAG: acetyltransferase [Acidobacteriota bacterium]
MAGIETQRLTRHTEFAQAVRLQQQVWGFAESELLPVRAFVVASEIGGQVFGAFDGARMVGFCLAVPGLRPGGAGYLHSQMLGVLPEYRDRHVGRALKLAQRRDALEHSIELIEWTFDPLELKNAYFNIERLGAVVRRYVLNKYGTTTSPLHGSLPTDRCVAEWWLRSPRVDAALAGNPLPRPEAAACIEVPANIDALRRESPAEARRLQSEISGKFIECFRRGLAVTGFERGGTYLLTPWPSE